ncbi:hypothetical protein CFOL_v3_16904, partial [Cephalotus follicularis]
ASPSLSEKQSLSLDSGSLHSISRRHLSLLDSRTKKHSISLSKTSLSRSGDCRGFVKLYGSGGVWGLLSVGVSRGLELVVMIVQALVFVVGSVVQQPIPKLPSGDGPYMMP